MNNPQIVFNANDVNRMIKVLKEIHPIDYDGMYNLVATVDFLEGKLAEPAKPMSRPRPVAPVEPEAAEMPQVTVAPVSNNTIAEPA